VSQLFIICGARRNMQGVRVDRGGSARLGTVRGDLEAERNAGIEAQDGLQVTVEGRARFKGDATVGCDFECGSLKAEKGTLRIAGNLVVHGDVNVENALIVDGSVTAGTIGAGGKVKAKSIKCTAFTVGGTIEVSDTLEAESVRVGGRIMASKARIADLNVGGHAEVGRGSIQGRIRVGGTFLSKSELEFGSILVGGRAELGTAKGDRIEIGGRLAARGDVTCRETKIGGMVEIDGNFGGETIEVGGELKVSGSLALTGRLAVGGLLEVHDTFTGKEADIGGGFRGGKAVLAGAAKVDGRVETSAGFKAGAIKIGANGTCRGPLVGGEIELGKRCEAEGVYGSRVVAGKGTNAKEIVAQDVELHDGTVVGRITYTGSLEMKGGATCKSPPEKAASLPAFPL
jgi:cytoskeletal protein CcmA (bactofilin family)